MLGDNRLKITFSDFGNMSALVFSRYGIYGFNIQHNGAGVLVPSNIIGEHYTFDTNGNTVIVTGFWWENISIVYFLNDDITVTFDQIAPA